MFTHIDHNLELPNIVDTTTELGRTYTTSNGNIYPSITTVLSLNDVEWLAKWRESCGDVVADRISKAATVQGEAVHQMVEFYLDNMDRKEIIVNRPDEYKFMFNQLRQKLKYISDIYQQEAGLYSDLLGVAGRVDCIAYYKGKLSIIDFKTSSNIKDVNKISNYFKQGAAYSIMWQELTGISIDTIVILMAVKNSLMPLEFIEPVSKWVDPLIVDVDTFYESEHGLILK